MIDKFNNKYRIKSSRLQNWDYAWNAAYFVTICTKNREYFLGNILNGNMKLSPIGNMAHTYLNEIPNHFQFVKLGEFIIMPNHIHVILVINKNDRMNNVETRHALSLHQSPKHPETIGQQRFQNQGKNTLSSIIGSYKSAVTKDAHRQGIEFAWQSRFHDHIIRDNKSYQTISEYIVNNPIKWQNDRFYQQGFL